MPTNIPTHADLVEIAKEEMLALNSLIDTEAVDMEGHGANIIVNTGAAMCDEVGRQATLVEAHQFLDTAQGDDLERLVYDRYGLTRMGASPSLGTVEFTRPTAGQGAKTLPSGTVLLATDGIRFITTASAIFGASELGPVSADIRSELAGAGQAASAGAITAFATTPSDSSIVVTNPTKTAGDADKETDPELRERARHLWKNLQRGTLEAVEYGAQSVPGIKYAVATEITDPDGRPARWVRLQIADRNGNSSEALARAVSEELRNWRPCGSFVEIIGGNVTFLPLTIALLLNPDAGDPAEVIAQVRGAIVAFLATWEPGRTFRHADIIGVCMKVTGVVDAAVIDPPASLVADVDEAWRTTEELITVEGL